jgi:hypothetical protein
LFQGIDDGRVLAIVASTIGLTKKRPLRSGSSARRCVDRGISLCPAIAASTAAASAARSEAATSRPDGPARRPIEATEQHHETGVGKPDPTLAVDRRNGHRRVVEEAGETHLGDPPGLAVVAEPHVESERARGAHGPVGGGGNPMQEPDRQPRAVRAHQIDVEDVRFGPPGGGGLDHRKRFDRHHVADMCGTRLELARSIPIHSARVAFR